MPEVSFSRFLMLSAILFLAALVVAMGQFIHLPWLGILALLLLLAAAAATAWRNNGQRRNGILGWGCSILAWISLFSGAHDRFVLDEYFAALAGAAGLASYLAGLLLPRGNVRSHWQLLGFAWGFLMCLVWLGVGYASNQATQFYAGGAMIILLLIAMKCVFKLSGLSVQVVNTLILCLIGIPVADLLIQPSYRLDQRPDMRSRLYSFAEARKDPRAFNRWWYYFVREWRHTMKSICLPATNGTFPFLLRPATNGMMFESRIRINQHGFRGPDFPAEKGNAYRILAIGESTTFGHTIYEDDVPWPRLLERIIAERLSPGRPVQVINAGIPSYTLQMNLERLQRRLLSFQPDLIISYHGYNGFDWLIPALATVTDADLPNYEVRPMKLLADAEYRLKIMRYRWHRTHNSQPVTPQVPLWETQYAAGYRELIDLVRSNHIQLAVANYSMSVNNQSQLEVINFYRAAFPQVLLQMGANELHSQLVRQLTLEDPDILFVDTHPRLDGQHEKFIDLVHFTQEGREDMAEIMFDAIKPVLTSALGQPGG